MQVMRFNGAGLAAVLLFIVFPAFQAQAGKTPPKELELSGVLRAVEAAKSAYRAPSDAKLKESRAALKQALDRLGLWLKATPGNEGGWREQVELSRLERQVALAKPEPAELAIVLARFEQGSVGLELKPLVDVRNALRAFLTQARYAASPDLAAEYRARLDDLAARLPQYEQSLKKADGEKIGETLAWLEGAEFAPAVTAAIRQRHGHPNVRGVLILKPDFLRETLPIDDADLQNTQRTRSNILGTDTSSTVSTKAELTTNLALNPNKGEIRLNFSGSAVCRGTVGRKGPATIYSHGRMHLWATQAITLDADGLHAEILDADARVNTQVDDIEMSNLVFKKITAIVAKKKVASKKEEAEQVAGAIAARRFREQIEKATAGPLATTQAMYDSWLRTPLERVGMFPKDLEFKSTDRSMEMTGTTTLAAEHQLGSHKPLPALGYHNAGVVFHQTFFNNISRGWVHPGTSLVRDDEIERMLHFLVGRVPRELRVFTGRPRWSITLAPRPFDLSIDDGKVELTLVLESFRQQGATSPPLRATAVFEPVITRFGPQLNRQGSVHLVFEGDVDPALRDAATAKLDALLAQTLRLDGLIAPHGGSFEVLAELQLKELICDDGVFGIGYDQVVAD